MEKWKEWKHNMVFKLSVHLYHLLKCLDMQQTLEVKLKVEAYIQWNLVTMNQFQKLFWKLLSRMRFLLPMIFKAVVLLWEGCR